MRLATTSIAFLVALGAAATGCKKEQSAKERETAAEPAPAAEEAPRYRPVPQPESARYELSATQVGPLTSNMPATTAALRKLFPDAEVSTATAMAEGTEYEIVKVAIGGEEALAVSPRPDGAVDRVRITSERFRLAGSVGVGSTFEELQALGELACIGGADDYGDSILCRPKSASTLAFIFEAEGADAYYAKPVPPEAQAELLAGQKVGEILWQPAP